MLPVVPKDLMMLSPWLAGLKNCRATPSEIRKVYQTIWLLKKSWIARILKISQFIFKRLKNLIFKVRDNTFIHYRLFFFRRKLLLWTFPNTFSCGLQQSSTICVPWRGRVDVLFSKEMKGFLSYKLRFIIKCKWSKVTFQKYLFNFTPSIKAALDHTIDVVTSEVVILIALLGNH